MKLTFTRNQKLGIIGVVTLAGGLCWAGWRWNHIVELISAVLVICFGGLCLILAAIPTEWIDECDRDQEIKRPFGD